MHEIYSINLPTEFVRDSAFSFQVGWILKAKIVIEKINWNICRFGTYIAEDGSLFILVI